MVTGTLMVPPACPRCGDRYPVGVRCLPELPVHTCRTPAWGTHTHWYCSRPACEAEWLSRDDVTPAEAPEGYSPQLPGGVWLRKQPLS